MKHRKLTTADTISIIALVVNTIIVVGLAIWNTTINERLARLEYEDYAPRLRVSKISWASDGYYNIRLTLQNSGAKDIEQLNLVIDSYILYPLRSCQVRLPHKSTDPEKTNDVSRVFMIYNFPRISPSESITLDCMSPSILAYYEQNPSISPFDVEDEKCRPKFPDHPEYTSVLPRVQATGTNLTHIEYQCTSLPKGKTPY